MRPPSLDAWYLNLDDLAEGEPSDGSEHGPKPGGREAPVAQKSSPAAPPVIAVRMETLLASIVERVAKFPREHKFTVGDRLVETCLDITSHLVEASYQRDKHAELSAASRALVRARVLVRLARAVRCVSEAQHLYLRPRATSSVGCDQPAGGLPHQQHAGEP